MFNHPKYSNIKFNKYWLIFSIISGFSLDPANLIPKITDISLTRYSVQFNSFW